MRYLLSSKERKALTSTHKFHGGTFFSNSDQNVPFSGATVPRFPVLRTFDNRNLSIAHTRIFSPKAVNQFRAGYSRIASRSSAPAPLTAQAVGISRVGDPEVRSRTSRYWALSSLETQ